MAIDSIALLILGSAAPAGAAPIAPIRALDLTAAPFDAQSVQWMDRDDYTPCQDFATKARRIEAQAVRYASVRDSGHRANIGLLDPAAFATPTPAFEQTWYFRYEAGEITAFAAFPSSERYAFVFEQFGLAPP